MERTIPVTHYFAFGQATERMRPFIMAEFVANGATNLVLSEGFIREVMRVPGFAKSLKRDMALVGCKFVDSHAPFGVYEDLNVPSENLRRVMLDRQRLALEIAADFGVDSIAVHVGNPSEEFAGASLGLQHECILRSLEELLPTAERLGITIAMENIWYPTNTPEKLLDIIDHFKSENLGICYDTGHANLMARDRGLADSNPLQAWGKFGPVPYDAGILEKLLPHVTTCHLHDNNGAYDLHMPPSTGDIDWPREIGLLKKAPKLKCFHNESKILNYSCSIAETCRLFDKLLA